MITPRPHPPTQTRDSQATAPARAEMDRALDRRHQLDEQQRAIRDAIPRPHFARPRPR